MFEVPSADEWLWIYGPLAVVLLVCVITEYRTNRIPNILTGPTFIYILAARIIISPWFVPYLISAAIAVILILGIGWHLCGFGGGAAKLAVAVAAGLPPWMALTFCVGLIVLPLALSISKLARYRQTIPGAILVLIMAVVVVSVAAFFG